MDWPEFIKWFSGVRLYCCTVVVDTLAKGLIQLGAAHQLGFSSKKGAQTKLCFIAHFNSEITAFELQFPGLSQSVGVGLQQGTGGG